MTIAGLILAAGASHRLGRPKQLLALKGAPLLAWPIAAAKAAGLDPLCVVLGHSATEITAAVALHDCTVAINADYREGMSSSLRLGLGLLPASVQACVVMTGDQPLVPAAHLTALVHAAQQSDLPIVATDYHSFTGVPMLLKRTVWAIACGISGDKGARTLLQRMPEQVLRISATDEAMAMDIDTESDYQALLEYLG